MKKFLFIAAFPLVLLACNKAADTTVPQTNAASPTTAALNHLHSAAKGKGTYNLNAQLSGPDLDHLKWSCPTKGSNCKKNKKSSLSDDEAAAMVVFNRYYDNGQPNLFFSNEDYNALFGDLLDQDPDLLKDIVNNTVTFCRSEYGTGETNYLIIPSTVDCGSAKESDALYLWQLD